MEEVISSSSTQAMYFAGTSKGSLLEDIMKSSEGGSRAIIIFKLWLAIAVPHSKL